MTKQYPDGWYQIARSREVAKKPLRRLFQDTPLVLFRSNGKISALHDRCPHRSARLSDGQIVGGNIECPYHGWQFDGAGICKLVPLHEGKVPRNLVPALQTHETAGLIFLRSGVAGPALPHTPDWVGPDFLKMIIPMSTRTTLVDLAENAFEPIHSLFVHKNISRGLSGQRSEVRIKLSGGDDRVYMTMQGEKRQDGLMSKFFESSRSITKAALIAPGIMETQYWNGDRLTLIATLYFTPAKSDLMTGYAVMQAPRQWGLGYIKAALFWPFLKLLLRQDKIMLRNTHENWEDFGRPVHANSPLDFLRPHVESVLRNERPTVADHPQEFTLKL